jgi:hypothetical protein
LAHRETEEPSHAPLLRERGAYHPRSVVLWDSLPAKVSPVSMTGLTACRLTNEAFQAAREGSERIKQDAYAAANQLAIDCIDTADAALRKGPFNPAAKAVHEHAYSAASDARAGMYAEAEQRHANRLAAIQRPDDLVHTGSADLREHGAQCHLIRVDIRNQGNTRHRNDLGDYSVW